MFFTGDVKKMLLSEYSELDILSYYIPDYDLNNNIRSPLRLGGDRDPSFSIYTHYHKVYWYDHGLGRGGDIFEFVRIQKGLNYISEVFEKIYEDLKKNKVKSIVNNDFTINKKSKIYEKSHIKLLIRKPLSRDINFWKQYLYDLETLNTFKVHPIRGYMLNNSYFEVSKHAYGFIIGSRVKIYQPYYKPKYFGNTNSNSIQGWNLLNFNRRKLLLVSSLKEVMVLYEQGIQAIAPNSESTLISTKVMKFLKFYFDIEILYDWDLIGRLNAKKHSNIYNLQISKYQNLEINVKDISDFRKKYGNLKQIIDE